MVPVECRYHHEHLFLPSSYPKGGPFPWCVFSCLPGLVVLIDIFVLSVIGTLRTPNYALLVSHSHPEGRVCQLLASFQYFIADQTVGAVQCIFKSESGEALGHVHNG